MPPALSERAAVMLGDSQVGVLVQRGEASRFEPAEDWANLPAGVRPVLGQQFEDDPFSAHGTSYGVPWWFEHLLPERDGPLRSAVARSLDLAPERSYGLLLALGADLPGAVRVVPYEAEPDFATVARRERLAESSDVAGLADGVLRVSLAGLQFKLSGRAGNRGIAVAARGDEGDWILKFADQRFPTLPANEFVTMSWASESGLNVPSVRLLEAEQVDGLSSLGLAVGPDVFAIERYDRGPQGRIHQEDFAQVLGLRGGSAKYNDTNIDTIVNVVARLAPQDVDELISRLVFCIVCGNDDAHAKNWSLIYPDRVRARLSPAYDLVSSIEYFPKNDMGLRLARAKRFRQVNLARFRALATRTGLDPESVDHVVREAVGAQVAGWMRVRGGPQVTDAFRDMIDRRIAGLPLVTDVGT